MLRGAVFLRSCSLLQVATEAADSGWASSRRRILPILQPHEYPPHVRRKDNLVLWVSCSFCLWYSGTWCSKNYVPLPDALHRGGIASSAQSGFRLPEIEAIRGSLVEAALEGWCRPRRWRNERLHHLIVRRWRRQNLSHGGLTPIRSLVPHGSLSSVRNPWPIWCPP